MWAAKTHYTFLVEAAFFPLRHLAFCLNTAMPLFVFCHCSFGGHGQFLWFLRTHFWIQMGSCIAGSEQSSELTELLGADQVLSAFSVWQLTLSLLFLEYNLLHSNFVCSKSRQRNINKFFNLSFGNTNLAECVPPRPSLLKVACC